MFSSIDDGLKALRNGKFVLVCDDSNRENEGDLIIAAEFVTPEKIAFMLKYTSGILCVPMTAQRLHELALPKMVKKNTDNFKTPFTVSVDAKEGVSTGISASDRATTIKKLILSDTQADDLVRPGHIFPLEASPGGVLQRAGHTEATVDLCTLAKLYPAGVIGELMCEDGSVASGEKLFSFASQHNVHIINIEDLIAYRREKEVLVVRGDTVQLPTAFGVFDLTTYTEKLTGKVHLALVKGFVEGDDPILVRAHSECLTGDVFFSKRCDCGEQLHKAMETIGKAGKGVIMYMRQEGRGIGLLEKVKAYNIQDRGYDTVEANTMLGFKDDLRQYGIGAQILRDLGLKNIILLTNNPRKIVGLDGHGLKVVDTMRISVDPNACNVEYLRAKKDKMGHLLDV
jgi:3,4-dihydroxy 2-butanone 4-phosphate synthase / GTP cyclohydrolase II